MMAPSSARRCTALLALIALGAVLAHAAYAQTAKKAPAPAGKTTAKPPAKTAARPAPGDSVAAAAADTIAKAAADTVAVDTTSIQYQLERQTKRAEDQSRQINEQKKQLESQQQTLESLNRRLSEIEARGDTIPPDTTLEQRLKRLESSVSDKPELPPDIVSAGNFPGSLRVPGSDAALKFGGAIWASLIRTFDALGSDDRFLTNSIPVDGTPEAGKGDRISFTSAPSRFNIDLRTPTTVGQVRAFIEGDFEGPAQQFRMRHAFGQYGRWIFGQTWSTFSDPDLNIEDLDFEGLNAKNLRRQAQVRYTWRLNDSLNVSASAEQPSTLVAGGASVNQVPDVVGRAVMTQAHGHLQAGVVMRQLRTEPDTLQGTILSALGYGVSLSGIVGLPQLNPLDRFLMQVNTGHGIARYVNDLNSSPEGLDAAIDPANNELKPLPTFALAVALEHHWYARSDTRRLAYDLRSTLIWGYVYQSNFDFQPPDAYHITNRISLNLIYSPVTLMDLGVEFIYGTRENKDGNRGDAKQLQFRSRVFF